MKKLSYLIMSFLLFSLFSCVKNGDPVTVPLINGNTSYTFYAYGPNPTLQAGGTVTATAGTTVTVRLLPNVPPISSYDLDFILSGANFTYNSSNPSKNALVLQEPGTSTVYATFVMPASGSVSWNGSFGGEVNGNSATIEVY